MAFIGNTVQTQGFIPATDTFSGNGSTTAFTLSRPVASVQQVFAVISNVDQDPNTAYTVSGNTITFTSAPPSGTNNIYVRYTSLITQTIAPSQGTVGTAQLGTITNIASGNSSLTLQTGTSPTTAMTIDTSQKVTLPNDASISGLTVGKGANAVLGNTVLGNNALASGSQSGTYGVAIGTNSLTANTSGGNNVGVGTNALTSNTTGANNIAIGRDSAQTNTTGGSNVAIGGSALNSNTTASNNTAVGYQAGYSNTTAANNTLMGYKAGYALAGGDYACFIGDNAGISATTGRGNTFVGSGYQNGCGSAITTGGKNTILGAYTGNQGGLDIRTASNYIVLSDGDGNPRIASDGSGNVSIGIFGKSNKFAVEQGSTATATGLISNNRNISGDYALTLALGANCNDTSSVMLHCTQPGTRNVAFIYGNGNLANQNNSYGSSSDIKLKENIVDATPKLEDLCKVQIRNYNLKTNPNTKHIGVIAQELETIFPNLIDETPDFDTDGNKLETTTKSVKYSIFVPMLIKAVQELNAKVTALEAQLGAK